MKQLAAILCFALALTGAGARTVIYPVEAIADFWKLGEEEYNAIYAGINITGLGPSDEGWIVDSGGCRS